MKFPALITIILIIKLCKCEPPPQVISSSKYKNGPLVYKNWPPNSSIKQYLPPSSSSPQSRRQLIVQLRSGKRPSSGMSFKRPLTSSASMHVPKRHINRRPLKIIPHQPHPNNNNNNNRHKYQHHFHSNPPNNYHQQHQYSNVIKKYPSTIKQRPTQGSSKIKFYNSPPPPPSNLGISNYPNTINNNNNNDNYVYENPFLQNNIIPSLPIESSPNNFNNFIQLTHNNEDYNPIHTIPAPNLSGNSNEQSNVGNLFNDQQIDNHIREQELPIYPPLNQSPIHHHQYQVTEPTNDQTIRNPLSGQQQYYAPDPDPSLPTYKLQPVADPYSQPSNYNELPADVNYAAIQLQNALSNANDNGSPSSSYAIQLASAIPQQQLSDTYGLPLTNQPQLQQYLQKQTVQGMTSVYNPTYLVTQSNQLFDQHQQHKNLFKPATDFFANFQNGNENSISSSYQFQSNDDNVIGSAASAGQIYAASNDAFNNFNNNDVPHFAALIGNNNDDNENSQEPLSQQEYSNLINFGNLNGNNEQGFIASNYYQTLLNGGSGGLNEESVEPTSQQLLNEETITHANQQLLNQQHYPTTSSLSAYEEHQNLLNQQFSGNGLKIYVPDDYTNGNQLRRSDNFYETNDDDAIKTTTLSTKDIQRKNSINALRKQLEKNDKNSSESLSSESSEQKNSKEKNKNISKSNESSSISKSSSEEKLTNHNFDMNNDNNDENNAKEDLSQT